MRTNRPATPETAELRRRAEERVRERGSKVAGNTDADPQRLVHELEAHQIELEMQNEELRAARLDVEAGLQSYTELFDFAPIGYFVLDAKGAIRQTNIAGALLLSTERGRLVGKPFVHFVAASDRAAWGELFGRVLTRDAEDPGSEVCELALLANDTELAVHLTAAALHGREPTALVAVEDVSRRKAAEAALRDEARHKDEFLAMLSHELRNPLAPIRNSLYLLKRTPPGGEQAQRAQDIIDRQVGHLTRILDDLLDVTRIARGKVHLQRERIDLVELVRRTIDDHRAIFEAGGIQLDAQFGWERLLVDGDPTRLCQVLGNLLTNATKFTSRGGRVAIELRREGAEAALSVRDTGVGIAPEMRAHLFEPFTQAPQTLERGRGGLGLGLAMVKGLVELHGGTVDIASAGLGCGSEFRVRLPLQESAVAAPAPAGKRTVRPFRVLVIEDNVDAAESLRGALELDGHLVQVAYDGPAGLALAREFRPEIVICDIGLPGMDGHEVARALRGDELLRGSYLIALSGYALPEDLQRSLEAGFDHHLAKPPTMEKLQQLFEEAPAATTNTKR